MRRNLIIKLPLIVALAFVLTPMFVSAHTAPERIIEATQETVEMVDNGDVQVQIQSRQGGGVSAEARTTNARDNNVEVTQSRGNSGDALLRACQNRSEALRRAMDRFIRLSQRQVGVITTIHERVDAFYERSELEIEDYEAQQTEIERMRIALLEQIQSARSTEQAFSCEGETPPREQVAGFRESIPEIMSGVGEYRTQVRGLTQAVRQATLEPQAEATAGDEENVSE